MSLSPLKSERASEDMVAGAVQEAVMLAHRQEESAGMGR
jgi:hypothetical protein